MQKELNYKYAACFKYMYKSIQGLSQIIFRRQLLCKIKVALTLDCNKASMFVLLSFLSLEIPVLSETKRKIKMHIYGVICDVRGDLEI